ncbi:MAG: DUF3298 and DUF4163 domain-containing protein [Fimbriimonadaceae bacterium]|nr:DUF3298 and DUF4163 domain-containing protein [Fimbriimonadaceae bacterium]
MSTPAEPLPQPLSSAAKASARNFLWAQERGAWRAATVLLLVMIPILGWSDLKHTTKTLKSSRAKLYEAKVSYPVFAGSTPLIRFANAQLAKEARSDFDDFVKSAREGAKATQKFGMTWEHDQATFIAQANSRIISVYTEAYSFTGGAHPNTFFMTYNFMIVKGKPKQIKLSDLVSDPRLLMNGPVLMELNVAKKSREAGPETSIDPNVFDRFVLTPTSITWIFQPYAVGAYAEGSYEIKLPLSVLKGYARPDSPLAGMR